jgi:hypothetical protein
MTDRETDIRRQIRAIGSERAALVRKLETLEGQAKMRDTGRGYDAPVWTSAQRARARELGRLIDQCDTALAALQTLGE